MRIAPWPGEPVIVAIPESTARSHIMSPQFLPPELRAKFGTVISDVASTGNSGSGVFDASRKCLLGIMSRKIQMPVRIGPRSELKISPNTLCPRLRSARSYRLRVGFSVLTADMRSGWRQRRTVARFQRTQREKLLAQQREVGMDALINFFTLRPTFTFFGLKIVWYLYLVNVVVQAYLSISGITQALAQRGISLEMWSPNFLPYLLGVIAQLAIVRLLLEVAAIVIANLPTPARSQTT